MKNKIITYMGVGNHSRVLVRGHFFRKYPVKRLEIHHKAFDNFKQAINRFRMKPGKAVRLVVTVGNDEATTTTGRDGYFECEMEHPDKKSGWFEYEVHDPNSKAKASGNYFVPDTSSPAMISDIDDTLLISHSTKIFRKLRLVLFKNAHSRKLTHTSKYYLKIDSLQADREIDSYFYVSSSEWNLYDFLIDFFKLNAFPHGPFFLKRLKTKPVQLIKTGGGEHSHKFESIDFILRFYPQKKFYLLGDSGQKDIDIYLDIVKRFPERINAIVIRKLGARSNYKKLQLASAYCEDLNIPFVTFTDRELQDPNFDNSSLK